MCLRSLCHSINIIRLSSGKSESITITNKKGRLSKEDIERMVQEAGEFASEDEAQRKRIEALNALSSFVYGLKGQLSDQEGLGARKSKMPIRETDWIDENGQTASSRETER